MRLYLAGPMSGYPEHNFPAFDCYRDRLTQLGFDVISPADLTRANALHYDRAGTATVDQYATFLRVDIAAMLEADGIALMPGWADSKGAKYEGLTMSMLNKPFFSAATGLPMNTPVFVLRALPHEVQVITAAL